MSERDRTPHVRVAVSDPLEDAVIHTIYADNQPPLAYVVIQPSPITAMANVRGGAFNLEGLRRLKVTIDRALAIMSE